MMRSLFSAVSGLKTHQQRMDVIGNNIANVNTPGFKKSRVTFQDMLNQTIRGASRPTEESRGGTNPMQVGPGVSIASIDTIFGGSSLQDTGKATDLGIDGDGFFILSEGGRNLYTRMGNFEFDSSGNLVNINGLHVKGWMPDDSSIDVRELDETQKIPENLKNLKLDFTKEAPPRATSEMVFGGNLDSQGINKLVFADGSSTGTFTVGEGDDSAELRITFAPVSGELNEWSWKIVPTDSNVTLGGTTSGKISYDPEATATETGEGEPQFKFSLDNIGTVSVTKTVKDTTTTIGSIELKSQANTISECFNKGTSEIFDEPNITAKSIQQLVYDAEGNPYTVNFQFANEGDNDKGDRKWKWTVSSITDSSNKQIYPTETTEELSGSLTFDGTGKLTGGQTATLEFDPDGEDGHLASVEIELDFSSLTQFASESSAGVQSQNGYPSGKLESYSIDSTGTIVGVYSNGVSKGLAQVALANFANPAGLFKEGNSLYSETSNSNPAGIKNMKPAGSKGFGTIRPGAMEMSNVDLSSEFTDMIITQRGFQANSRVVTTSDEMLQELVNLKR